MLLLLAPHALADDFADEAKSRMKLNFDLDQVEAELAAPAPAPAAAAPTPGRAEAAPPPPRLPLEPNSTLDRVVVLRDRALVTRERKVRLDAGTRRVRFEGLPLALDATTLHAEIHGGKARVVGVELVSGTGDVEETERIAAVRAKALELSGKLGEVADRIESLLMQRAYLRGALLPTGDAPRAAPTLDLVKGTLAWVGDAERDLAAKLRADEDRAEDLGKELEPLLLRLRDPLATGETVRVDLEVDAPGEIEVELGYGVSGASWTPSYAARLDPATNVVTFETNALVSQTTGEAWTDAAVKLSTAAPVVGGAAPVLSPWILDEGGLDASALAVTGSASSGAGARVFEVAGRRSIAGDGSVARIPLASQQAPTVLTLTTVPRVTSEVFRAAAVTWNGESPLLPGEVASFVGGDFVGTASIAAVAPGEPVSLGFGVEDRVKVERALVSRKVEHPLGGRTRYTVRYRTVVHNYAKLPLNVRLDDQVPVSQVDRVAVSPVETSVPPRTDPEGAPGILSWDLALAPGAETAVELGFSVTAPRELAYRLDEMMM